MKTIIRTYRQLHRIVSFEDRFQYLKLDGVIGDSTFGYDRYVNQALYKSKRWGQSRDEVIIRDDGNDLGVDGYRIYNKILVHHMNPITLEDIELDRDIVYDPQFLICTSLNTHNAIHYSNKDILYNVPVERRKNDTCLWAK